jgi:hypothetical protein
MERRRTARFQVCHDTLVYNQDSFAEILNISFGGLACRRHVGMAEGPEVISDLELLNCDAGKNLRGLSCRRVRRCKTTADDRNVQSGQVVCYYEFVDLNASQFRELADFIESCAKEYRPELMFS